MSALRVPLLIAAAVALAALGLALILLPTDPDPTAGKGQQPAPSPTASTPATTPDQSTPDQSTPDQHGEEHEHEHEADPAQLRLVDQFAQAFGARAPLKAWLDGLEPHVTPELLEGFRYTDPHRRLVGHVRQVAAVAELEHVFTVSYASGETIAVTLQPRPAAGWVVAKVDPVKPPEQTGTDV